ncbi:MAG: mechanosensitive ion channel family protein [Phycisphaerales bacterium]|nr:mechanosensitive ion channel family protein [Phycisphaerales bacterium]
MMHTRRSIALATCLALLSACALAAAAPPSSILAAATIGMQASADSTTPVPAPPATVADLTTFDPATVSLDELRLRLRPLRDADLEAQLARLTDLVEAQSRAISAHELAARNAKGPEQQKLVERATELRAEQKALIERANVAVALLEARGVDVAANKKYLAAVSTGVVDDLRGITSGDMNAIAVGWKAAMAWITSVEGGIGVLKSSLLFILTLVVFWFASRIVSRLMRRSLDKFPGTSTLLRDFLAGLGRKLLMLVGLVVAISMLGVDITPLAAAIGAAGLVVGLALQGTLSNFASGIMILLYRPFDVGDVIEAGGVAGKVEAMTMVSTTIASADNRKIVVPNNSIWNGTIVNATGKPTRRVDLTFGIGYADDIEKAQRVLEEIVRGHELVLDEPEPVIRLNALADSSVNFIVRPWAKTTDYWTVYWDITRTVKRRFDEEDITIPFPQRDVHVHYAANGAEREQPV